MKMAHRVITVPRIHVPTTDGLGASSVMMSAGSANGAPFRGFRTAPYVPVAKTTTGEAVSIESKYPVSQQVLWHTFSMVVIAVFVTFAVLDHFTVSLRSMELHKSQTWLWWSIGVLGSATPGLIFAMRGGGPYTFYGFAAFLFGVVSSIAIYGFDHVHGTYTVWETRYDSDQFVTATISPTFLLVMGQWAAVRSILVLGFVFLGAAYFSAMRTSRGSAVANDKYP